MRKNVIAWHSEDTKHFIEEKLSDFIRPLFAYLDIQVKH